MERRTFLSTAAVGLSVAARQRLAAESPMPMRTLGKSGLEVSHFCLGGFHMRKNGEANGVKLIHRALDLGVNFFDSAHKYHQGESDITYGVAFQSSSLRQKALLMSKAQLRTGGAAMQQLEETLRRMKTDYLDLWQCHEVSRLDEVERIFSPGGSLEAFVKAKEQGKVRHIGFTGHHDPEVHKALLAGYDGWETIQHPVNLIDPHYLPFQEVMAKARAAGYGLLAMKSNAIGHISANNIATIAECLRYAMAQNPHTIVSGVETIEQLEENVGVIKNEKPFTEREISTLLRRTSTGKVGPEIEQYKRKNA